jgi:hypothetical protein
MSEIRAWLAFVRNAISKPTGLVRGDTPQPARRVELTSTAPQAPPEALTRVLGFIWPLFFAGFGGAGVF